MIAFGITGEWIWACQNSFVDLVMAPTIAFQGMSKGPAKLQILAGDLLWDFNHGWGSGTMVANLAKVIYDV